MMILFSSSSLLFFFFPQLSHLPLPLPQPLPPVVASAASAHLFTEGWKTSSLYYLPSSIQHKQHSLSLARPPALVLSFESSFPSFVILNNFFFVFDPASLAPHMLPHLYNHFPPADNSSRRSKPSHSDQKPTISKTMNACLLTPSTPNPRHFHHQHPHARKKNSSKTTNAKSSCCCINTGSPETKLASNHHNKRVGNSLFFLSFFLSCNPSSSLKTNIHNPDKTDQQTNKKRNNTQQQQATVASSSNKGSGCNVAAAGSQATWAVLIRKDGKKLERKSLGTTTTTDGLRTGAAANWSLNLDTMAGLDGWGRGRAGRGGIING